ncbi:MAG: glutathione S-transferase family protein [Pseudomonadota bacterium]|nr:glutathione S-transferase family protein [Pseudomonadota bacterium]
MTDTIAFYHNPQSRGRIVHWMLEEVNAPYEIKVVDFNKKEHKSADFLAINPMGKIPAIVHRGTVVTECAAICAYLADAFPAAGLAPATDDPKRGTYLRWLFFGAGCVEPAIIDQMFSRPPPSRPEALSYGNYTDTLNTLEKAISPGPFVVGERFSAADVYVGSAIGWGLMMKAVEPRPAFAAYMARVTQRPAHQRAMAQSEALMPKSA